MKSNHVFENKKVFSKNIYLSKSWKYFEYTPANLISFTAAFWALKKSTSAENMLHNIKPRIKIKWKIYNVYSRIKARIETEVFLEIPFYLKTL